MVRANPLGEQVVAGAATFNRDGGSLTIRQGTDRAVINWNSFSIGAGEITRFVMPSSSSAVLNRVITAHNPSQIYGTLQANGQVYLINPAGVFVGPGGLVDTASFVASTRDIATEDFMRGGDLRFSGNSDANILNQGKIEARQGDVFLIARQVSNEGQIMASDGTVGLVSGTEIALHALGPHNYKVRLLDVADGTQVRKAADGVAEVVNAGVIEAANAELEATGNYLSLAIRNTGTIRATGVQPNADGSVTLTGGEGDLVNQGVVAALKQNIEGKFVGGEVSIAAKNVTLDPESIVTAAGEAEGGKVAIDAKDTILAGGKIEAGSEKGKGGDIVMTGERVGLVKAVVDASGATGGGEILVGGDYLGSNPNVRNAKATVMTSDSVIRANATENGDGGRVILWSDEYTGFYGEIFARGGLEGGDGGFVETSSKFNLQAWGKADIFAPVGRPGAWLLDPYNVYIVETNSGMEPTIYDALVPVTNLFTATTANAQISVSRILAALNSGQDVIIRTGPPPTNPALDPATEPFTSRPTGGAGDIVVTVPIQAEITSTGNLTLENKWVIKELEGVDDLPVKAGSIIINENCPITLGGSLTLTAGSHLGSMPLTLSRARLTNGGEGGDVIIGANSPIYSANGRVTLNAGLSLATASGGVGGDVVINSSIYAGRGLTIAAGDADKGWNWNNFAEVTPYQDFVASTPIPAAGVTVYDLDSLGDEYLGTSRSFPAGSYLVQGSQRFGTTDAPPGPPVEILFTELGSRNGVTPGSVQIASGVTFYLGNNSASKIRAGNAGNNGNAGGGNLTVANTILALGNNVSLVLASGSGTTPGNLTTSAQLGASTSGTTFDYRSSQFTPRNTAFTSTALKKITLQSGNLVTIGATIRAETAEILPLVPEASLWLNHQAVDGTFAFRMPLGSLNNLIGVSLGGTPTLNIGTQRNNYFDYEIDPVTLLPGNLNITQFGDISLGRAGPIDFQFARVNFYGKGSAVSFDTTGAGSGAYSVSLPTGGTLSFDTQGEIFTNFLNSQSPNITAIKIPGGTVNFIDVSAPGNSPSQGPQTGLLKLDVATIQGTTIRGPAFIQNNGNTVLGGLTTVAGWGPQGVVTVTSITGQTAEILSLPPVLGIANNPGDFSLASGGTISLAAGALNINRDLSLSATGGFSQSGGTINVARNLNIGPNSTVFGSRYASTGGITQSGGTMTVTAGNATMTASSGSINQTGGTMTVSAGNATLSATAGTISQAGTMNVALGNATFSASGNITQSGTLGVGANLSMVSSAGAVTQTAGIMTIGGTSLFNGATGLTVTQPANTFTGPVTLTTGSGAGRDATFAYNRNGLQLASFSIGGDLTLDYTAAGQTLTLNGGSVGENLDIETSGGRIQQTAALVVQGTSAFTAGSAVIDLSQTGNNFGLAVSLSNSGNNAISITDANSLILGSVNKPGSGNFTVTVGAQAVSGTTYTLTQAGVIQTGTVAVGGGSFTVVAPTAGSGGLLNMDLSTQNNIIGATSITPSNPTQFRNFMLRNTARAGVNAVSNPDADPGLGTLTSLQNLSVLYGTISGSGLGTGTAPIALPAAATVSLTGNLQLLGTAITQGAGSVLVVGSVGSPTTATIQATGGVINLNQAGNNFSGAVNLANTGNFAISITDRNNLILGSVTKPGTASMTVTVGAQPVAGQEYSLSQNGIIETGSATIQGGSFILTAPSVASGAFMNVYLSSQDNIIRTPVFAPINATQFRDYQIRNTAQLGINSPINPDPDPGLGPLNNLRNLSVLYGTLAGTGLGTGTAPLLLPAADVETSGALQLLGSTIGQAAGARLLIGTALVPATSTIQASSSINLTQNNNFTGAVSLRTPAGGNVSIADATGGLILGASSVGGNLGVLSSGGSISQVGAVTVADLLTLTAGGFDVNLASNGNNQIGNLRIVSGNNVSLASEQTVNFASGVSTISGNLEMNTSGGGIQQSAPLVVSGNTTLEAGNGVISLGNEGNSYGTGLNRLRITGSGSALLFVPVANETNLGDIQTDGIFTLRTGGGISFKFPWNGAGTVNFDLTTAQLQGFDVGTFAPQARGGGGLIVETFNGANFPNLRNLSLITTDGGNILGTGSITTGGFSFYSDGSATFNGTITADSVSFSSRQAANFGGAVIASGDIAFDALSSVTFNNTLRARSLSFASTGPALFNQAVTATESLVFDANSTATFGGTVTTKNLSFVSDGAVAFNAVNSVQNLGNFSIGGVNPLVFQNGRSLNLTGAGEMGGRLSMEIAGYFANQTGEESPLRGVAGGSVIKSLSLFGSSLSQLYGLAGFTTRYDGIMPTSGNVMSYALSPMNFVVPSGTVIAGVDLGGLPQAGQQLNTFETGANDLNWMVSDFASFNLPSTPRATLEYRLYPQRVEPETRTLPAPTLGELERELGRPPTVEEVQAREIARREASRLREGAILERSSFDQPGEASENSYDEAREGQAPTDGSVPQADGRKVSDEKTAARVSPPDLPGPQARKDSKSSPANGETSRPNKPSRVYANDTDLAAGPLALAQH